MSNIETLEHDIAGGIAETLGLSDKQRDWIHGFVIAQLKSRAPSVDMEASCSEITDKKDSALYKALWALRHAMQVKVMLRLTPTLLLFHNDDYSVFQEARTGWEHDSLEFLQSCLKQADAALTDVEDGGAK